MRTRIVDAGQSSEPVPTSGLEPVAKTELDLAVGPGRGYGVEAGGQEYHVPWTIMILRVQIGVIQQVKKLPAEFDTLRLLDRKKLVYREIDVLEAGATAGISAHVPVRVDVRAND